MAKKIILIGISFFLLLAIPITFFVVQQQQEIRQKAAPATTLSLGYKESPSSQYEKEATVAVGDEFELDILISTGDNQILTADVQILYDQTKLELLSIKNSPTFPNQTKGDDSTLGVASLQTATINFETPYSGENGVVGTLRFKALSQTDGVHTIRFSPESNVFSIRTIDNQGNTQGGRPSGGVLVGSSVFRLTISGSGSAAPTQAAAVALENRSITPTATPSSGLLNVSIAAPPPGSSTSDTTPTISGKAKPGTTINLIFSPGGLTGVATTDSTGNWSFTPVQPIAIGNYSIAITATDLTTGQNQIITTTLTIGTIPITPTSLATPTATYNQPTRTTPPSVSSDIPVTGTIETTLAIAVIGFILLIGGAALPILLK